MKSLESDLATYFCEKGMGRGATRKHSSKVVRGMIERGKAFPRLWQVSPHYTFACVSMRVVVLDQIKDVHSFSLALLKPQAKNSDPLLFISHWRSGRVMQGMEKIGMRFRISGILW